MTRFCDPPRLYRPFACFLKALFFSCISFSSFTATAQTLPTRHYTTADGLISDRVSCITQDEKGFIWIGTWFGISKYDGYSFTTLPLPAIQQNKYVSSLTTANEKLYAGFWFNGGLMEYSRGKVTAYTVPGVNDVTALCAHKDSGIVVASGENAVYHFVNGKFKWLFTLDSQFNDVNISTISMDSVGVTWVGTPKGLIFYTPDGQKGLLHKKNVASARTTNNGLFVLEANGPYCRAVIYKPAHGTFFESAGLWDLPHLIPVPQNSFHQYDYWLAAEENQFFKIENDQLTGFSSIAPATRNLNYTYADRENNLWIATNAGLFKISNLPARSYTFPVKAIETGDITGTDSSTWSTNAHHLYLLKQNRLQKVVVSGANKIGRLFQNGKYLWVGSQDVGLWRLQPDGDKIITMRYYNKFGGTDIRVHCFTKDAHGNVWAGGQNGIFLIKDDRIVAHCQPRLPDGQPLFTVGLAVDAKNGMIWAGDNEQGIFQIKYYDSGRYEVINHINAKAGLTDQHIRSLLLDSRGNLWAGTRFGGIFQITDPAGKLRVKNLSSAAGAVCGRITDIKEDKQGSVWMATCNGIYRYEYEKNHWQSFTTANGLADAEVYALTISGNGDCRAVSPSGVTVFGQNTTVLSAPPVNITGIMILGKEEPGALYTQENNYWSAGENSIGFRFAGASYTDEKKVWYKYMLEGYEKTWSLPTQSNQVNYVSLPPGHYTFKVMAAGVAGQWSKAPAAFSFTIVRPFYKSPLFFILLLSALFAIVYFIRMYRLRQNLKLERLRSRISEDLHDDIGSTLSSISIMSEGAIQEKDMNAARSMMREINDNALQLMDKMDDIIWCVNPQNDSFGHLILRIKKFAASLFEARGIDYDIDVDQRVEQAELSMEHRQHLYLIIKEAINNLVKYSGATKAGIHITYSGDYLMAVVNDNGAGFDPDAEQEGNGVRNMKRRAKQMNAMLQIDSSKNGTRMLLRAKIK